MQAPLPRPGILEEPGSQTHLAQLYRRPEELASAVAVWIGHTLRQGGGAVLAARAAHAALVRKRLLAAGLDAWQLERRGRLVIADADALIGRFISAGAVDRYAFRGHLGAILRGVRIACQPGRPDIRVWGEIVDVLRERGEQECARDLERAWSEIIPREGIRLLCSYNVEGEQAHGRLIDDIHAEHGITFEGAQAS